MEALVDALKATKSEHTDYNILTTPQLHYLVRCINTKGSKHEYGDVSEKGYYEKLSKAFVKAMRGRKAHGYVTVDCANGVGGSKLQELVKYLPGAEEGGVEIKIVNDDVSKPDRLNYQVSPLARFQPAVRSLDGLPSAVQTMSRHSNGHHRLLRRLR